ncbi:MAG: hypothetical protein ACTSRA_14730 [Promethearchaeota archaeon]
MTTCSHSEHSEESQSRRYPSDFVLRMTTRCHSEAIAEESRRNKILCSVQDDDYHCNVIPSIAKNLYQSMRFFTTFRKTL